MLISKFSGDNIEEKIMLYADSKGITLPEQLCIFLKKYNGGETPRTSFSCQDVSSDLRAFYGLGDVKYSLNDVDPLIWQGELYLPIALDTFGNHIVIGVSSGKIFFENHETGSLSVLTQDLISFLQICKSEIIPPAARRTIQEREQALIQRGRGAVITDALRNMWQAEIDKYSSITQEEIELDI